MNSPTGRLAAFLAANSKAAVVEVTEAKGSTPREEGAWMLVSREETFGTIGGGQLEFMAIARARELLGVGAEGGGENDAKGPAAAGADPLRGSTLQIPLGPEIGQCCGGRVELAIRLADAPVRDHLREVMREEREHHPHVYLFGGGHVGHALAEALALLPVRPIVVETRGEALEGFADEAETRLTAVPEEFVRAAPPGSAYVVLTHDHALDFLIVMEALKRKDAAYVGMIGSATKKATFRSWYLKNGGSEEDFARLVTPIGGGEVRDKRPAVIAALAAAEIVRALG